MPTEAELLDARLTRMKQLVEALEHVCSETADQHEIFMELTQEMTAVSATIKNARGAGGGRSVDVVPPHLDPKDAKYPQRGDVIILDLEPEGALRIFWVRTQARGSATPVFEGVDAWARARAAAEELAGSDRPIWVRHRDGHFEKLANSQTLR